MTKAKTTKSHPNAVAPPMLAKRAPKSSASEMLVRLHQAAQRVGIQCLETEWRGKDARYRFRCAHGHDFIRTDETLRIQGIICPKCRENAWYAVLQAAAVRQGGRCLETRFLGKTKRYRFVCADGHRWSTLPLSVTKFGRWCPLCAAQQRGKNILLEDMDITRTATRAKKIRPKVIPIQAKSKRLLDPSALRIALKLNQHDFWSALGITQSGGSRYEHGLRLPKNLAVLMELVYVKKLNLERINAEDMGILSYLKTHEPRLYATLVKAVCQNRRESK